MISRVAYAQLVGQNFHPPRVFGRWAEKESNPDWKAKNLGMKIVGDLLTRCLKVIKRLPVGLWL